MLLRMSPQQRVVMSLTRMKMIWTKMSTMMKTWRTTRKRKMNQRRSNPRRVQYLSRLEPSLL